MDPKIRKIGVAGVTAAMAAGSALAAMPTMAGTNYQPVQGTTMPMTKYLIVKDGANVPNVAFYFDVTAPDNIAQGYVTEGSKQMEVKPGPNPDRVTMPQTGWVFGPTITPLNDTQAPQGSDLGRTVRPEGNTTPEVKYEHEAKGEKYAAVTNNLDFRQVTFPEPGIYRYLITERNANADQVRGIVHDDDTTRILDVYVTDDGTGRLSVSSYVLHVRDQDYDDNPRTHDTIPMNETNGSLVGGRVSDKTDGFTNEFFSSDLAFKHEVTGNQASRDKYFKFHVTLTGLTAGDEYDISVRNDNSPNTVIDGYADLDVSPLPVNEATNPTYNPITNRAGSKTNREGDERCRIVIPSGGAWQGDFYLQHGQSIVIRGLPYNATYQVTAAQEDYLQSKRTVENYTDDTSGTISALKNNYGEDIKTSIKHQRQGLIPTGVLISVIPGAMVVLGGGVGLATIKMRKRKEDESEE